MDSFFYWTLVVKYNLRHFFLGLALLAFFMGSRSMVVAAETPGAKKAKADGQRPRIGIALGGGGALGFAHVGVLRVLEQQRVPVDCIVGTSMGSIVGGLYASGMSPDEIEDFMSQVDWWDILKDSTPRKQLHFRRKRDDARYLMDIELGLRGARLTMPSGFAAGQKFNNVMQMLTLNAIGIDDFDKLNIPYRAVATDLRTGEVVVLDQGNLATAMRASMAVPGVFTPVELDGRLLVDGGVVNNIPVDVVRAMDVDVIIAVDVGASGDKAPEEMKLETLNEIVGQTFLIVRRPSQREQVASADVAIEPDLTGFTAATFHKVAPIIAKGEAAAAVLKKRLARYAVPAEVYQVFLQKQRARRKQTLTLSSITVQGNQLVDERRIRARIQIQPGDTFAWDTLESDLAAVYGFGDFQAVTYRLIPRGEQHELAVSCQEKPWGPNYLRFGLRLESDLSGNSSWHSLLNVSRLSINRLGGELALDLEIGTDRGLFVEWYQPLDYEGFTFLAPRFEYRNEEHGEYRGNERIADYAVESIEVGLDAGLQFGSHAELRLGPRWYNIDASVDTGATDLPEINDDVGGFRGQVILDRLDDVVFARNGHYLAVIGDFVPGSLGANDPFEQLTLDGRWYGSIDDHTAIALASGSTGFNNDLPDYAEFQMGGAFSLTGLADGQMRGDHSALGSLGYRYRLGMLPPSLGEGIYVLTRIEAGLVWDKGENLDPRDARIGTAIALGADTALGPAFLGYGIADGGASRAYISLGTLF